VAAGATAGAALGDVVVDVVVDVIVVDAVALAGAAACPFAFVRGREVLPAPLGRLPAMSEAPCADAGKVQLQSC
jgi:hypothetical protein